MSVVDQSLRPYAFAPGPGRPDRRYVILTGIPATKDGAPCRKEAPRSCRSRMLASALSVIASTNLEILHFTAGL